MDEKQVEKRVTWALEEQQSATTKIYDLISELPGTENIKDNPRWQEITQHLADCQSHLTNALRRFEQEGHQ